MSFINKSKIIFAAVCLLSISKVFACEVSNANNSIIRFVKVEGLDGTEIGADGKTIYPLIARLPGKNIVSFTENELKIPKPINPFDTKDSEFLYIGPVKSYKHAAVWVWTRERLNEWFRMRMFDGYSEPCNTIVLNLNDFANSGFSTANVTYETTCGNNSMPVSDITDAMNK